MPDERHRFPFHWKKVDLEFVARHGHKVFSTFSCGGGNSFGYRMAGFDVIGCNEANEKLSGLYKTNHDPRHVFCEGIKAFSEREDLPDELFELDVLDGSPPAPVLSTAGKQTTNDSFFDYLALVEKLKPKVAITDNGKRMTMGKAKGYCKLIRDRFDKMEYETQLFILNAGTMGVPQMRERVFFVARRRDVGLPAISLKFDEVPIAIQEPDELDQATWPQDYDFLGAESKMRSGILGMGVPPVMMAQIAAKVAEQWFDVKAETIDSAWR